MFWLRRFPFTACLLIVVATAAICAQAFPGSLDSYWSMNFGFAPRHLVSGELLRLVTSVFLTHDALHLASALCMILLVVAQSERVFGSIKALILFGLSHLTSMLVFAIGVGIGQWALISPAIATLYDFHDVGPSAGYYGSLGGLLLTWKSKYRSWSILAVIAFLVVRATTSANSMPESHAVLSADIVHLIAVVAGMAIYLSWPSFRPALPCPTTEETAYSAVEDNVRR